MGAAESSSHSPSLDLLNDSEVFAPEVEGQFLSQMKSDQQLELSRISKLHPVSSEVKVLPVRRSLAASGPGVSRNMRSERLSEVRHISQQGAVASILSGQFRRVLEDILSNVAPTSLPREPSAEVNNLSQQQIVSTLLAPDSDFRARMEQLFVRKPSRAAHVSRRTRSPMPIPQQQQTMQVGSHNTDRIDTESESSSDESDGSGFIVVSHTDANAEALAISEQIQVPSTPTPTQAPLQQSRPVIQVGGNSRDRSPMFLLTQYLLYARETIEDDKQQLEADNVVGNMLRSEFRGRLEAHVRARLSAVDSQRPARANARFQPRRQADTMPIPLFPPPPPPPAPAPASNHQSYASASTSAPTARSGADAPMTKWQLNVVDEIRKLKDQMAELTRVIPLMLDLQMDMQRALRQEVASVCHALETTECKTCKHTRSKSTSTSASAAATNTTTSGTTTPAVPAATSPILTAPARSQLLLNNLPFWTTQPPLAHGTCLVCDDAQADSVFYRCGHMCVCNGCAHELRTRQQTCPMCRAPVIDVIRVFLL